MADTATNEATSSLEGGSYEVIHRRLLAQAAALGEQADRLNAKRKEVFGGGEMVLTASERVRTENNCRPRDVVSVAGHLLFGFEVFLGLRENTEPKDIFALYKFKQGPEGWDLSPVPFEGPGEFLAEPQFVKDFTDVFRYTRGARLVQLRRTDKRLLALVQIGSTLRDLKVFRWAIDGSGRIRYMDARGEEDAVPPRTHGFHWIAAGREHHVAGRFPHINVLDTIFVETTGGDLTVKLENNTSTGVGIYREPVDDPNQTLDDAEFWYAALGKLILLKIKPFRETDYRYLVFNTRTEKVVRVDAIGQACLELPEDQGIVFPGGYCLESGEYKIFDADAASLEYERTIRSPNGEDVLYVFYRPGSGQYSLLPYNLIQKDVQTPVVCNGYSLFADGNMVIFRSAASDEATRVHPVQIWQTPFVAAEHAAAIPTNGSYLAKIGNADLVRGISDAYTLRRLAGTEEPTRHVYEDLIRALGRVRDAYYWLGHPETFNLLATIKEMRSTTELIIDEFEKQVAIQRRADDALGQAEATQKELLGTVRPDDLRSVEAFLSALTGLRKQRGHLVGLREMRAMKLERVNQLDQDVVTAFDAVSQAAIRFFLEDSAWKPLLLRLASLISEAEAATKAHELAKLEQELTAVQDGLSLLSEVVGALQIEDTTARTRILEGVSTAFSQQNRARAVLVGRQRELGSSEARAEFAVQFRLFGQAVTGALALCNTPEACDEQLSRLLVQLEELESRFDRIDEAGAVLVEKRVEVTEAVASRRESLVEERQRRARNIGEAADRILNNVTRRSRSFANADELNSYFASDPMIAKLTSLVAELRNLGEMLRADDLEAKAKSTRQDSLRALRDKTELFDEGGNVIKLGQHRFSVQTQALELALVPREGALALHLTGTDFYEFVSEPALLEAKEYWDRSLVSEAPEVYRGEYLAATLLGAAELGENGISLTGLQQAGRESGGVLPLIREAAASRLDEGYERGVHDSDAALILEKLLVLYGSAGLLRYTPDARALGCLTFARLDGPEREFFHRRAQSAGRIRARLGQGQAENDLALDLRGAVERVATELGLSWLEPQFTSASRYLVSELSVERPRFVTSAEGLKLQSLLFEQLDGWNARRTLEDDVRALAARPREQLGLLLAWLDAFLKSLGDPASPLERYRLECAALWLTDRKLDREPSSAVTSSVVEGLLGTHPRIKNRTLSLTIDEFLVRLGQFESESVPRYRAYRKLRADVLARERERLRLEEFAPKVMSSFVRNRLIDEVYLPLVGANLAKQMGTVGAKKRTDLMGMLLLVSPPGYGKTTLMEYVANRLGLIFMKVNGPALGHDVKSLDPTEAPNATARQEVEKINLALEMGNNVMLYLDDIQHTNTELLQKFISLCDAQRKIEGVWRGHTRTYDLRGKRFCVVMAGNPYTESGARFQIPDMLANRADTYNLGDILEGKDDAFALSYLENALTSNAALAPLAARDPGDVQKLIRMARGDALPLSELTYPYSAAEAAEIMEVLKRLFQVQEVLLRVNREYIASASQADAFRTEPPFKLQGSYRNMNKVAEKVASALNAEEMDRLIDDHYKGESQTLTQGAEQNLLKLGELRGKLAPADQKRWRQIKEEFLRQKRMGGKGDDPVTRVTGSLAGIDQQLQSIKDALVGAADRARNSAAPPSWLTPAIAPVTDALRSVAGLDKAIAALAPLGDAIKELARPKLEISLVSPRDPTLPVLVAQQTALIESTLVPLVDALRNGQSGSGRVLADKLAEIATSLRGLEGKLRQNVTPPLRVDVQVDHRSPSNFWRTLEGEDLVDFGGLFIATYSKPPSVGSPLALTIGLPGGVMVETMGTVVWTTESYVGEDSPSGYGVRLDPAATDARARSLFREFARVRDPWLRDS